MKKPKTVVVQKRLLQDVFVLLVSLVLTEPQMTTKQGKMLGPLIKRLKAHVNE